jgi:hypothetical protein
VAYFEVRAEGTRFYYADGESVEMTPPLPTQMPDPGVVRDVLATQAVRFAIFQSILRVGQGDAYFLYWREPPDLDAVDERVRAGAYTDEDFSSSVRTQFQITLCTSCKRRWKTLVIVPGDPYPGAPGLVQRKFQRARIELCPGCRSVFRQSVVLVLGQETSNLWPLH